MKNIIIVVLLMGISYGFEFTKNSFFSETKDYIYKKIESLEFSDYISFFKESKEQIKEIIKKEEDEEINNDKEQVAGNSSKINSEKKFINLFINKKDCDKILNNNNFFLTCYDYKLKGGKSFYAKIPGKVYKNKYVREDSFRPDKNIPIQYRTYHSDYYGGKYDRGHSGLSSKSGNVSKKGMYQTFIMSNIVPQKPKTNRYSYLKIEKYIRKIAYELDYINVITLNYYSKNPKRIGKSKLAVPKNLAKILWNKEKKFQKCFFIPNDNKIYKLKEMEKNCQDIIKMYKKNYL